MRPHKGAEPLAMPPEVRARGGRRAMSVVTGPAAAAARARKGRRWVGLLSAVQAAPAGDRREGASSITGQLQKARPGPARSPAPAGTRCAPGPAVPAPATRGASPPAARGQGRARDVPGAAGAGMAFAMHAEWHIQARQLPRLGRLLPAQGAAGSGAYPNARCRAPTQARPVYIIRLAPARMGRAESVGSISGGPARSRSLQ